MHLICVNKYVLYIKTYIRICAECIYTSPVKYQYTYKGEYIKEEKICLIYPGISASCGAPACMLNICRYCCVSSSSRVSRIWSCSKDFVLSYFLMFHSQRIHAHCMSVHINECVLCSYVTKYVHACAYKYI